MLTLKTLKFKGIGRFVDQQEISLDNFGKLIQVDGLNKNTGGSSGAAKSTIFNALEFLFGINSISNSMLQSRLTDESMLVEGEFDLDGQPLVISRGKKLKITLNGEVTTGSAKLSEEKLDQILAIPRNLFRPMLHKKQGDKGFFLNFTPSEMNSFLTDCLGLGEYKNKVNNLDVKITELDKTRHLLVSKVEAANASIKAYQEAAGALGLPPIKETSQEDILRLKTQSEAHEKVFKDYLESVKLEELDFISKNTPKLEVLPFDTAILDKAESSVKDIQVKINELLLKEKDLQREHNEKISSLKLKQANLDNVVKQGSGAKDEAFKAANEILKIRKSICPRCEQIWANDAVKVDEAKTLEKIEKLKSTINIAEQASFHLENIKKEIESLVYIVDPTITTDIDELVKHCNGFKITVEEQRKLNSESLQKQNAINRAKQEEFDLKLKELRTNIEQETIQLRGQWELLRRCFEVAVMKLKNYVEASARYQANIDELKKQKQLYTDQHTTLSKELNELELSLTMLEELKRAIKSYLSCSFDEALETISENATKMIQNIPNMQNATIQLCGIKENKNGSIKEEVNAIIHMDGEENIPIKTLSGGERASVDIAIDLSVLSLIEERTGKGINLFIMDEPFQALDSINMEQALEVIKNSNTTKTVIIVEHNPIIKEMISDRIVVVREGQISHIQK